MPSPKPEEQSSFSGVHERCWLLVHHTVVLHRDSHGGFHLYASFLQPWIYVGVHGS